MDTESVAAAPAAAGFRVVRGTARLLFAFDIGLWVDLDRCEKSLAGAGRADGIRHAHRAPADIRFEAPPVRLLQEGEARPLRAGRTLPAVEMLVYEFGAVSVAYNVPLDGDIASLVPLATDSEGLRRLELDARERVAGVLDAIRAAVDGAALSPVVEDYLVYQLDEIEPALVPGETVARHRQQLARILRAESSELAEDEVADALSASIAFGPDDMTLVDWNAALVFGRDTADVRAVLEYANVQLLEMRFLDRNLDRLLDRAYETLSRRRPASRAGRALRDVGRMQVDGAILFERVSNALKLLGDQYLARLYRLAARRFHLEEWNKGILRKLETIEGIYQKLADGAAAFRMELLEWVIIVLIAVSIGLPFVIPHLPW
jgi:hypothetical protein